MEHVSALGHLGHRHLLVADGADVVVSLDLLRTGVLQAVDFPHGRPPLHKCRPAVLCLAPDVEVGVDEHHAGSDGSPTLKYQDPTAVEEEEDSKEELDRVTESPEKLRNFHWFVLENIEFLHDNYLI